MDLQLVVAASTTDLQLTIDEFLIAKRQAGRSAQTIEKYRETLQPFSDWLAQSLIDRPDAITRQIVRRWGASLYDCNLMPATIRQRTAAVRSFLGWCYEERIISEDLRLMLKLPPVKRGPQRTLSADEIRALLDACDLDTRKGVRDRALILFLLDSGVRAGELCRLAVADLKFEVKFSTPEGESVVHIASILGKGNKPGVAYFGDKTATAIRAWLDIRERYLNRLELDQRDLFISTGGKHPGHPLTVSGLRALLRKIGDAAGVEKVSTHAFRRSMACLAEEAGASSREVIEYGRWESIELVERYTQAYRAGRQFSKYSPVDYVTRTRKR